MVLIVLLSHGTQLYVFMGIHVTIIVLCYIIDRYYNSIILPITEFQRYADNIISIMVAGVFIGMVIKGLSGLFIRAQVKANAASKAKSDFLAQMSHEMRTPMNAIIGITSILAKSDNIEDHKEGMKKIEAASKHLLGVINDILDMSKIEADKLELFEEVFDFHSMLGSITTVMNSNVEAKRQKLVIEVDPALPRYFVGDKQRLAQVLANLLSNAIKFSPDESEIKLDAKFLGEEGGMSAIRVDVSDKGIGISEEQMLRLFSSFEQADNSISRKYGGTGLGLSISKRIINMMGGRIWALSKIGLGSTFSFEIKLPTAEAPDIRHDEFELSKLDFTGKTLLIAEDIDINREIIIALLEPTHISIECAHDGKEAVDMFIAKGGGYDLVFMDIQMPGMDGYEATRTIRASGAPGAKSVPIIAMTANVFKEDVDRAIRSGMNNHLAKPIVIEDVLQMLARYLLYEDGDASKPSLASV
jgi:signal transduction histidine kinase/ActR/RegA family two-component response regulator